MSEEQPPYLEVTVPGRVLARLDVGRIVHLEAERDRLHAALLLTAAACDTFCIERDRAIRQRNYWRAWARYYRSGRFDSDGAPEPLTGADADGWLP